MLKVNTPQKINLQYAQLTTGDRKAPPISVAQEIIFQEYKYKRELWRLQKILRRALSADDPLPLFNRRHLLILVKRLCKDIDYSTSRMNKDMDMARLSHVLEISTQVPHNLLCIAYSDALYEMREFLRRETGRRNDSSICYCTEIHGERALLPLHRLRYLKALSCFPRHHKESISAALDGCFEVLSSLHSQDYVSEVDNLLDFALIMGPPPTLSYENVTQLNDYNEIIQFRKAEEAPEDHDYEEIELLPILPEKRKLTDLFLNNNDKTNKHCVFPNSRFTVSAAQLCT